MKKYILFIFLSLFSFSAIHAEIEWTLSKDGTLTISGTGDMPDYDVMMMKHNEYSSSSPWFPQKDKIKKVVIENGVTSIGDWAFFYCQNLASIIIPNSVMSIGEAAFNSCEGLTSITIPNSVKSIGNWTFSRCFALASITIPNSVTCIGESAFSACVGLTSIIIPNSVTSIGESAFFACNALTSIIIPESVTSIGKDVFSCCKNITSITFEGRTPPEFEEDVFVHVNKSIPVYVPANSLEAYKKALGYYFEETSIQALQR